MTRRIYSVVFNKFGKMQEVTSLLEPELRTRKIQLVPLYDWEVIRLDYLTEDEAESCFEILKEHNVTVECYRNGYFFKKTQGLLNKQSVK